MKTANFFVSIIATLLALGMVYGAFITPSPMKTLSVVMLSIISLLCSCTVVICYNELKD